MCISEAVNISPVSLDSSLCFFQSSISHDVLCIEVSLQVKAGANGKFFGSVTNKEVADKLLDLGFDIDKKKIVLPSGIKTSGAYPVTIKISPEETAKITLNVLN